MALLEKQGQEEHAAAAAELRGAVEELQLVQSDLDRCKQDLTVAQVAAEERLQQDELKEQQDVQVSWRFLLISFPGYFK